MRRLTLFLSLSIIFFLATGTSYPVTFDTYQLTANGMSDSRPSVYNGTIAWEQLDSDGDGGIFLLAD